MADFTEITQEINEQINTNGTRSITGNKLNTVLRDIIAAVNAAKEDSLQYYSEDEDNERVDIGGTSLLRASALENIVLSSGVWTVRLDSGDDNIVLGNTNNNTKIEIRSDEINLSVDCGDGDMETLLISNHGIRWNDEPIPTTPDFARVAFSGSYADLNNKPDLSTKADKVSSATNGHFAGLDSNGNLTDSGIAADDVVTKTQYEEAIASLQQQIDELKNKS